jgi:hypothetical protein
MCHRRLAILRTKLGSLRLEHLVRRFAIALADAGCRGLLHMLAVTAPIREEQTCIVPSPDGTFQHSRTGKTNTLGALPNRHREKQWDGCHNLHSCFVGP